jgi:hypothetical protein
VREECAALAFTALAKTNLAVALEASSTTRYLRHTYLTLDTTPHLRYHTSFSTPHLILDVFSHLVLSIASAHNICASRRCFYDHRRERSLFVVQGRSIQGNDPELHFNNMSESGGMSKSSAASNTRAKRDTSPGSSGLLNMTTELRLEVYNHLIENCLANGFVSDVAGLYFCCREIQSEIEAEYMAKIRPLLQAKCEWQKLAPCDAPLRVKVRPNFKADGRDTEVSINIPVPGAWSDQWGYWEVPETGITTFYPIFASKWSLLTLSVEPSSGGYFDVYVANRFFSTLDRRHGDIKGGKLNDFRQIDRLVLNYGKPQARVSGHQFHEIWERFYYIQSYFLDPARPRNIEQAWISRVSHGEEPGWRLTFDFRRDLQQVTGALWKLEEMNKVLEITRLFTELEDVNANCVYDKSGIDNGYAGISFSAGMWHSDD